MSTFDLAKRCNTHLVVYPSDLLLKPPQSYLFIQDGLIIACGVLYSLCYIFYITRSLRDRKLAGYIEYVSGNLAWELYYAFATASTRFETLAFSAWFCLDVLFTALIISISPTPGLVTIRVVLGFIVIYIALWKLTIIFPDDRDQVTAYWTGILLQLPVGWGSLYFLLRDFDLRGHSLEIWIARYLGCLAAYGVFIWRYLNVPENWTYVGSFWSKMIMFWTLVPETIYPFMYMFVWVKTRPLSSLEKAKEDKAE
ncbi:uncharacterized protein Z519_12714 [Cladophialophora bantiana CBS 173.52]|uniref:Uncharacterized protein n=1 Tax=Cladophialophora bantiana (strain ATCC 10958 / CBS 173.52 / CDC B-1940 / NIH 8579) TaxID=1442370 RepID=A0A0D2HQD2_CLAB1|nr:uncharacterized protein Z519_12714 [Cladophialophora bantiana CBS 173.52]KIW86659.1 hypothetical protein Z519_12714 [Cladophialophora bantiana CBS 173.52]